MAVYLVTYDLNKEDKNYEGVISELEKSLNWCKPLLSTWLISTTESADALSARIRLKMDANDFLLVIEVKPNYEGWLHKSYWEWIRKYLR
jgi:hypothetical protein